MYEVYGLPSYRTIRFCACEECSDEFSESENGSLNNSGTMDKNSMEDLMRNSKSNFVPTVSWNTVPVRGRSAGDDYDSGDEGSYVRNYHQLYDAFDSDDDRSIPDYRGTSYLNVQHNLTDRIRGSSPIRPGCRSTGISGSMEAALQNANITIGPNGEIKRRDYPSKPMLVNDALIKTIYSIGWKEKWREQAKEVEKRKDLNPELNFKYPDLFFPKFEVDLSNIPMVNDSGDVIRKEKRDSIKRQLRVIKTPVGFHNSSKTILVHVNGRKHTWVALDYTLVKLAKEFDYVVVLANLPKKTWSSSGLSSGSASSSRSASRSRTRMRSLSRTRSVSPRACDDGESFWSNGYTVKEISDVLQNLTDYCILLTGKKKLKLTVEVVIGSTKKSLVDATNAYVPDFFVIGNSGSSTTLNSKGIGSALMTYYPIPVILTFANKMNSFERRLRNHLVTNRIDSLHEEPLHHEKFKSGFSSNSSESIDSDIESCDSFSTTNLSLHDRGKTLEMMNKLRSSYRRLVANKLQLLENDASLSVGQRKIAMLDSIINSSLNFNKELDTLGTEPELLELKRTITGGIRPPVMKKRSMLDVVDKPTKPRKTASTSDIKDGNHLKQHAHNAPRIILNSPSPSFDISDVPSKKESAIKFAASVKPSDGRNVLQKVKSYDPEYNLEMNGLNRQLSSTSLTGVKSNQTTKPHSDLELRKVSSANPIERKKKSKSKFFSFLFKGGSNSSEESTTVNTPNNSSFSSRRNSLTLQPSHDSENRKKGRFQRKK